MGPVRAVEHAVYVLASRESTCLHELSVETGMAVPWGSGPGYRRGPSRSGANQDGRLGVGGQRVDAVFRAQRLAREHKDRRLRDHLLKPDRWRFEWRRTKQEHEPMGPNYKSLKHELAKNAQRPSERARQVLEQPGERLPQWEQPRSAALRARRTQALSGGIARTERKAR